MTSLAELIKKRDELFKEMCAGEAKTRTQFQKRDRLRIEHERLSTAIKKLIEEAKRND